MKAGVWGQSWDEYVEGKSLKRNQCLQGKRSEMEQGPDSFIKRPVKTVEWLRTNETLAGLFDFSADLSTQTLQLQYQSYSENPKRGHPTWPLVDAAETPKETQRPESSAMN